MAAFDAKAYEDEVLKPLRRHMPHLPKDLKSRYAVEPGMDDAALQARVDAVFRLWNKQAMRQGPLGLVAQQLVHEHNEFIAADQDPATPGFWDAWNARHSREVGGAIEDLTRELATRYGSLKAITEGLLRAEAAAHSDLGEAELSQARQKAGLALVDPVALPVAPRLRGQLRTFTEGMLRSGAFSVPQLLFPDLVSFGLLDRFSVTPRPPNRTVALSHEAATERMVELDKLPDGPRVRAERQALGLLVTEGRAGTDLAELALFHLLQEARDRQADGAQVHILHAILLRTKLRDADAARIALSLVAQGTARRTPSDAVAELLADGRLKAAQQAAAGLPSGPDGDASRALVERVRARVATLRALTAEHLAAGRDEQARGCLREAVSLAVDLPDLTEQLAGMPTPPVLTARAGPDAGGVRITWQLAPSHGEATVVQVVRGDGRSPDAHDDGTVIPVEGGHATDSDPPVGQLLHYAVFAREDGGRWSRPIGTTTQVVPPVTNVVIEGGPNVIAGHWRVHPDVAVVEVRRATGSPEGDGEPVVVDGNRSFRDTAVVDGTQYFYTLVAVYPSVPGGPAPRSTPVSERGATWLEADAVASLTVAPVGGDKVRLSWRHRPGNEVVIRRAAQSCPWEFGVRVDAAELAQYGVVLDGGLTTHGGSAVLVAALPAGSSYLVPFTMDRDGTGVRGQDATIDLVDPVSRVQGRRFGDEIHLTWLWPAGASAAEVTWTGGQRRITLQQYRDEGGCHLRAVSGVREVRVGAIVPGIDDDAQSAIVAIAVKERPTKIGYALRRRGIRLLGGVRCTVTLTSGEPVDAATIVLVASQGPVMPTSPGDCVELLRESVSLSPNVPCVLPEVTVPGSVRKPYWLRCFLSESPRALLVDPPVSQLKVL